jgi:electron transport complex protein RnfD
MSLAFGSNADQYTPISLHLLAGGTMLGAFFIATDPVSAATSRQGKLIYGAGIGILVYLIRTWGNYPDAVAFSVLLMNFAVPFIDYYTPPRTYGHTKARRGMPDKGRG